MASLREKVEAEVEQMDRALRQLPGARRVSNLSVLELAGAASLLSSLYFKSWPPHARTSCWARRATLTTARPP